MGKMRMKLPSRIVLLAWFLIFALASLTGQQKWVIGMSQCNLGEPWRVQMNADIRKAAAENPMLTVIFKDAQNDTLKQRAHVEEFVNARVNLLIISPKEAAPLTAPVAGAFRKGIPVVVLDRRVLGNEYTCFIGADNKRIGQAAGRWIAAKLGDRGQAVKEYTMYLSMAPDAPDRKAIEEAITATSKDIDMTPAKVPLD